MGLPEKGGRAGEDRQQAESPHNRSALKVAWIKC
jgi:hypothetical protein